MDSDYAMVVFPGIGITSAQVPLLVVMSLADVNASRSY